MVLAGEDDEAGSPGRTNGRSGVGPGIDVGAGAGQNLGVESGSKKRKAAVLSRDSNNLSGNGEGLEVECEASRRISMDIENLRSQLDEGVKELRYCEENEKLRAEMDLKNKEMQCLRKQNIVTRFGFDAIEPEPDSLSLSRSRGSAESLTPFHMVRVPVFVGD